MDPEESTNFIELTPVMLSSGGGERTDVKVPVSVSAADANTDNTTLSKTITGTSDTSDTISPLTLKTECLSDNNDDDDMSDQGGIVYRSLQALYRGLPKEMFVNRILLNEASCEVRLGEMRSELFEQLKEDDEFPYGLQCMLRRRVYTRNGDTVAVKYAYDIHTLMSVLEGADYSEMRDLLSSSSGKSQRSQSVTGTANSTFGGCEFSAEIKILTESMNSLKADILTLKQKHVAVETTRSNEIQTLKTTVMSLKSDLSRLSNTVTKAIMDIKLCAERIESEKSLGVVSLRNEFRVMKNNVNCIQDAVDKLHNENSPSKITLSQRKAGKKSKSVPTTTSSTANTDISVNLDDNHLDIENTNSAPSGSISESLVQISVIPVDESSVNNNEAECENSKCCTVPGYAAEAQGRVQETMYSKVLEGKENGVHCASDRVTDIVRAEVVSGEIDSADAGGRPALDRLSEQNMRTLNTPHVSARDSNVASESVQGSVTERSADFFDDRSYRDVVMSPAQSENFHNPQAVGRAILTRVTRNRVVPESYTSRNVNPNSNDVDERDDDSDFSQFVKKRAKRYYLGGFKPTITRQRIENFVSRKGPTVTWVRIWHSRRNPNNVVIRLNVEDNQFTQLLENPAFWPRGVVCRPWLNRNERSNDRRYDAFDQRYDTCSSQPLKVVYGRSDVDLYNPFSPLRDDSNVD